MCTENGIELLLRWGLLESLYSLTGVIDIVRWKLCQWIEGKSHKKRSTFNDIYQRNGADWTISLIGREQEILHYVSTDGLLAFYMKIKALIFTSIFPFTVLLWTFVEYAILFKAASTNLNRINIYHELISRLGIRLIDNESKMFRHCQNVVRCMRMWWTLVMRQTPYNEQIMTLSVRLTSRDRARVHVQKILLFFISLHLLMHWGKRVKKSCLDQWITSFNYGTNKGRQFLNHRLNRKKRIQSSYPKGGGWLRYIGTSMSLCARAPRVILNHAPIAWDSFLTQVTCVLAVIATSRPEPTSWTATVVSCIKKTKISSRFCGNPSVFSWTGNIT